MFAYKLVLIPLLCLFYFDCNSGKNVNNQPHETKTESSQNQTKIPEDLLITLERTPCFGRCPVYKLSIKADGSVVFEGINDTKIKGNATGKISAAKVKELLSEFQKADYANLKERYDMQTCPTAATDNSTAITSITIAGKQKTVSHYLGCAENNEQHTRFPPKLTELENKIDELVDTKQWIGEQK